MRSSTGVGVLRAPFPLLFGMLAVASTSAASDDDEEVIAAFFDADTSKARRKLPACRDAVSITTLDALSRIRIPQVRPSLSYPQLRSLST